MDLEDDGGRPRRASRSSSSSRQKSVSCSDETGEERKKIISFFFIAKHNLEHSLPCLCNLIGQFQGTKSLSCPYLPWFAKF